MFLVQGAQGKTTLMATSVRRMYGYVREKEVFPEITGAVSSVMDTGTCVSINLLPSPEVVYRYMAVFPWNLLQSIFWFILSSWVFPCYI